MAGFAVAHPGPRSLSQHPGVVKRHFTTLLRLRVAPTNQIKSELKTPQKSGLEHTHQLTVLGSVQESGSLLTEAVITLIKRGCCYHRELTISLNVSVRAEIKTSKTNKCLCLESGAGGTSLHVCHGFTPLLIALNRTGSPAAELVKCKSEDVSESGEELPFCSP